MRNLQITQTIINRENTSVESYFSVIGNEVVLAPDVVVLAQKIR